MTAKIYSAFAAMLNTITGGIQLYVSEPEHTLNIRPMIDPVVPRDLLERHKGGKVYVARLLDDIDFPNFVRFSHVFVKCPLPSAKNLSTRM